MAKNKKMWLIIIVIMIIISVIACVITLFKNTHDISSFRKDFIDNIEAFKSAAQYMMRTEGMVNIDKLRENVYGYTEETKGEEYQPSIIEKEAIILKKLDYRTIYTKPSGDVMLVKQSDNGIEKGIMKLAGSDFPPGVIEKELIQEDWYAYTLINN